MDAARATAPGDVADETERLWRALRREVWIVTAADGARRGGLTVTWLQNVSLDRRFPAALVALSANHFTTELVEASGWFAASLLERGQVAEGIRFASSSGRDADKLAGLDLEFTPRGTPRLVRCLAWFEAQVYARLEAGGRRFYWGEITAASGPAEGTPLTDYELVAGASADERRRLGERLTQDVAELADVEAAWRSAPPVAFRRGEANRSAAAVSGSGLRKI